MNCQIILDRIETVFQLLNPAYEPNIISFKSSQNSQTDDEETFSKIDVLLDNIQNWILNQFKNNYQKVQHYQLLESQLQKSQNQNRNHIRMEEQLRIYGESITSQLVKIEKDYKFLDEKAKMVINKLKAENKKIKEQNMQLKCKILNENYNCNLKDENFYQSDYVEPFQHNNIPSQIPEKINYKQSRLTSYKN